MLKTRAGGGPTGLHLDAFGATLALLLALVFAAVIIHGSGTSRRDNGWHVTPQPGARAAAVGVGAVDAASTPTRRRWLR